LPFFQQKRIINGQNVKVAHEKAFDFLLKNALNDIWKAVDLNISRRFQTGFDSDTEAPFSRTYPRWFSVPPVPVEILFQCAIRMKFVSR
jgi:hypothetical protein